MKRAAALVALHCGPSVHVITIEDDEKQLRPRRLAELSVSSESPAESTRAVAPTSADLDGDGLFDLLVPFLLVDAQGSPRGGALERLRARSEGGFDAPAHVIDFAAGAAIGAQLDTEPADLHEIGDAREVRRDRREQHDLGGDGDEQDELVGADEGLHDGAPAAGLATGGLTRRASAATAARMMTPCSARSQ